MEEAVFSEAFPWMQSNMDDGSSLQLNDTGCPDGLDVNHNQCHKRYSNNTSEPDTPVDCSQHRTATNEVTDNNQDTKSGPCHHKGMKRSLSKHDVPQVFRCPHVEFGFRPLHQPWSYYIKSIFSLHNEFMNIWTHLIPLLLQIWKMYTFSEEVDFIGDPYSWPLLAGMISGATVFACSSIAHCFHSKSEFMHYIFFMVDYAGIAIYAFGTAVLNLYYCTNDSHFYIAKDYFFPAAVILPVMMCLCSSVAKVHTHAIPHNIQTLLKLLPATISYITFHMPVVYRVYYCYMYSLECNQSMPSHLIQILTSALSAVLFASEIPQKWMPGKYDIFFHSHQLFHVAIAVSILANMEAVKGDFILRGSLVRGRPEPSFTLVFGPLFVIILVEVLCISYLARKQYNKMKNNIKHSKRE